MNAVRIPSLTILMFGVVQMYVHVWNRYAVVAKTIQSELHCFMNMLKERYT